MKFLKRCVLFCIVALAVWGAAPGERDAILRELAPTGKLRVAIGVSPAPSAFYSGRRGREG